VFNMNARMFLSFVSVPGADDMSVLNVWC
jgi:hypothetical protein